MRSVGAGLVAAVVMFAFGSSAHAQVAGAGGIGLGTVGGGWAVAPGYGGGFYGGYPYGPAVAFAPNGGAFMAPYGNGLWTTPGYLPGTYYAPPPMTVNTMGPLMYSIRRSTGRRQGWR